MTDPIRCAEYWSIYDRWALAMECDTDEANKLFALLREHVETCGECGEAI